MKIEFVIATVVNENIRAMGSDDVLQDRKPSFFSTAIVLKNKNISFNNKVKLQLWPTLSGKADHQVVTELQLVRKSRQIILINVLQSKLILYRN